MSYNITDKPPSTGKQEIEFKRNFSLTFKKVFKKSQWHWNSYPSQMKFGLLFSMVWKSLLTERLSIENIEY